METNTTIEAFNIEEGTSLVLDFIYKAIISPIMFESI
jgi:hypothetical protein